MKNSLIAVLEWVGVTLLNTASQARQRQAFYDRVAAVPVEILRSVDDDDHERIREARDAVSDEIWLRHARDALCIELLLTPLQVAGVLGAQTKRRNDTDLPSRRTSASTASAAEPATDEAVPAGARGLSLVGNDIDSDGQVGTTASGSQTAANPPAITLDPASWPVVPTTNDPNFPPTGRERGKLELDEDITLLCATEYKQTNPDPVKWKEASKAIQRIRRLTRQQVAQIVAHAARHGDDRYVLSTAA